MSKQRKNEKKRANAVQFSLLHKRGEKGPKSTTPVHGKSDANRIYTKSKRGGPQKRDKGGKSQATYVAA